jgi:restriction system protein
MITRYELTSWQDLQIKAAQILSECGFKVEIEKKIQTVRGTVEIDVYAEEQIDGRRYSILCECKNWKAKISQNTIFGFRSIINDIGSNVGYIITTSDYQSGAKEASFATPVELLTWESFQNLFLESWYSNYFYKLMSKSVAINKDYCLVEWFDDLDSEDRKKYYNIRNNLSDIFEIFSSFPMPFLKNINPILFSIPKLPLTDVLDDLYMDNDDIVNILSETHYEEFLLKFTRYSKNVINEFCDLDEKYSN